MPSGQESSASALGRPHGIGYQSCQLTFNPAFFQALLNTSVMLGFSFKVLKWFIFPSQSLRQETEQSPTLQYSLLYQLLESLLTEEWNFGGGGREGQRREGIYVYIKLIRCHMQKITQYCKAIILNWKNKNKLKIETKQKQVFLLAAERVLLEVGREVT